MDLRFQFITIEQAMWHHFYFGAEIICDGDSGKVDYR